MSFFIIFANKEIKMCIFKKDKYRIIRFYRDECGWFADIPNHTKDENEMVAGSDKLLEMLYSSFPCTNDEIKIMVSDRVKREHAVLNKISEDHEGAVYSIDLGFLGRVLDIQDESCWMCEVLKDVFGKYPKHIYIHCILKGDGTPIPFFTSMPYVARYYPELLK